MTGLVVAAAVSTCGSATDVDPIAQVQLAIAISSIVSAATGQPVNPQSVSDSIKVNLRVTLPPGGTATVETKLGSTTVCSRQVNSPNASVAPTRATADVAASQDVQTIECQLNTSAFNATTGVANFLNGPQSLTAEVFYRPQGAAQIQATVSQQLVFNNQSGFFATVTNTPTTAQAAVDADGQTTFNNMLWRAGSISVGVIPVVFSPAPADQIAASRITLTGTGMSAIGEDGNPVNGFTVTFPADKPPPEGVANVSASDIRINVSTITVSGAAGPGGQLPSTYAFDNFAPDGTVTAPTCVNSSTDFGNNQKIVTDPNPDFNGVNRVTFAFFAGSAGSETPVSKPQDLPQTTNTNAYSLAVRLTDALGNARQKIAATTSGNDYTPPGNFTFKTGTNIVLDRAINPPTGSDWGVTFPTDEHSKVAGIRVTLTRAFPALTGAVTCLIGNFTASTNTCDARQFGNENYPVFPTSGYQTFTATAVDFAGNLTAPLTRTVIISATAPTASQILPTTGGPFAGGAFTYQLNATDALDLNHATPFQCFDFQGTQGCVPVTPRVTLGEWGPDTFVNAVTGGRVTIPWGMKSLERTLTSGAPEGVAHPAVSLQTRVTNQANLAVNASSTFPAGLIAAPAPSFSTLGAQRLEITTAATSVGNGAPGAPACPSGVSTSLPITVKVTGTAPFASPFQTITLYFFDQGLGTVMTTGAPTKTTTTVGSLIEESNVLSWAPTGVPAQTATVRAIGIAANGAAWQSLSTNVNILNCA